VHGLPFGIADVLHADYQALYAGLSPAGGEGKVTGKARVPRAAEQGGSALPGPLIARMIFRQ
jgi:hypothetical protein